MRTESEDRRGLVKSEALGEHGDFPLELLPGAMNSKTESEAEKTTPRHDEHVPPAKSGGQTVLSEAAPDTDEVRTMRP
jgi:hypothetical protein